MKRATRTLLYAIGAVGAVGAGATFLFAPRLRPDERVTGWPTSRRLKYQVLPENAPTGTAFVVRAGPARMIVLLDGKTLMRGDLAAAKAFSTEARAIWTARRKTLPGGAKPFETDPYSKELYWGPSWLTLIRPEQLTAEDLQQAVNGSPFDEFGRLMPGHFGESDMSLWGQTFGALLKNPIFAYAVVAAAIATGPGGMAAYGAYTMWRQRGELTAKNVVFVAARTYVVTQCGPGCGAAFDMGLGLAQGKSIQKSARDALLGSMSPQARVAFEQGEKAYKEQGKRQ